MNPNVCKKTAATILTGILLLFGTTGVCNAQKTQTIAILPFEIISPDDITYIQNGSLSMLHSRLMWKDHVETVDKYSIQAHLSQLGEKDPNHMVKKIADMTGCDFVLTGSITQFADAYSIDTKIIDVKNKRYLIFSEETKVIDDVIPKINLLAARINKKVFDRESLVYENLVKQEKEKAEQWKRQNPENLMPVRPREQKEEKSSIWKFWEYL